MKPIKMTRYNEMLLQYPQSHQTDESEGELRAYLNGEIAREPLSEGSAPRNRWREIDPKEEEPKAADFKSWCALCGKHIPSGGIRYIRGEKTAHQKCVEELYEALEPQV
jgi:hypothetical protein